MNGTATLAPPEARPSGAPSSAPGAVASKAPAQSRWHEDGDTLTLELTGDWRDPRASLPAPPEAPRATRVVVDATALTGWNLRLAAALWHRVVTPRGADAVDLGSLPEGLRRIVVLAGQAPGHAAPAATPAAPSPGPFERLGARVAGRAGGMVDTFAFVGDTLLAAARLLRGGSALRRADLAWQVEQTGPRSVPIVALVSFLVGMIVAYMGAGQLVRFGAQTYIADLVTVGVVREIAALLVGIVLAGRVGAAFAAQLGSMRANEEIDALRTLGIDPFEHLVLPRVLALLVVGPLLTAFSALVGMLAGWGVAVVIFGVTPLEYALKSLQALTLPHLLIGLGKGTVYALLVALAGCRQGLAAGRSAQAVGEATTAAVVQAIVWIVVAASALTVMFQRLGW